MGGACVCGENIERDSSEEDNSEMGTEDSDEEEEDVGCECLSIAIK